MMAYDNLGHAVNSRNVTTASTTTYAFVRIGRKTVTPAHRLDLCTIINNEAGIHAGLYVIHINHDIIMFYRFRNIDEVKRLFLW